MVDGRVFIVMESDHCLSTYFADDARFPRASVEPDCALLMRDIEHEWHEESDRCSCPRCLESWSCSSSLRRGSA